MLLSHGSGGSNPGRAWLLTQSLSQVGNDLNCPLPGAPVAEVVLRTLVPCHVGLSAGLLESFLYPLNCYLQGKTGHSIWEAKFGSNTPPLPPSFLSSVAGSACSGGGVSPACGAGD